MRAVGVMDFAGSFAKGVTQAGFEYVAKREPSAFSGFGVSAIERNFQGVQIEVSESEFWSVVKADMVFGCPPCSGFSMLSVNNTADSKRGKMVDGVRVDQRGINAPDNAWMYELVDYTAKVQPEVAIFESVRGGGTLGAPLMRELWQRLRDETGLDYHFTDVFMNAASVGGNVIRSRYFWVVHLRPFGVDLPRETPRSLMEVLEGLPLDVPNRREPGVDWDWGHVTNGSAADERTRATIEMFRAEGYDWAEGKRLPEHMKVWMEEMGHPMPEWWLGSDGRVLSHARSDNMYSPFRWRANGPMGVVAGGFLDRAVHPIAPRTFTYREGARFMGLPDDWSLYPIVSKKRDSWLGKAIPVASGRWISTWARGSIEGAPGEYAGRLVEPKHRVIDVSTASHVRHIEQGADDQPDWWPEPAEGQRRTIYVGGAIGQGTTGPRRVAADTSPSTNGVHTLPSALPRTTKRTPKIASRQSTGPIERIDPSVVLDTINSYGLTRAAAAEALGVSMSRIAELVTVRKPGSWLNAERWPEVQQKLQAAAVTP